MQFPLNVSKLSKENEHEKCSLQLLPIDKPIPNEFNWHDKGFVTSVRNQGHCNSCYVFSTVAAMESQYMINVEKKEIDFSEQAILNCMFTKYSHGCYAGDLEDPVLRMINVGVTLEKYAPYEQRTNQCKNFPIFMKANGYCFFDDFKDELIKRMILRNGPAVVALNDNQFHYLKGPFNGKCKNSYPNHTLLLVGWNEKYWIIKNSWSTNWGVDGYLYLPINGSNCGINFVFGQIIVDSHHK